ncbi:hypothetical protein P692DRAFT_201842406 [Suillus brevipes Sb2]|nr:hypothetical protein P692DRAFT_201842406 [Suillus brevipes Sb2]
MGIHSRLRVPGTTQSNQAGEIANVSPMIPVTFITDSQYKWEDHGWINKVNVDLFRAMTYHLRIRSAVTSFRWVKGHSNDEGNDRADTLAGTGALKDEYDHIDTSIPPEHNLQGTKLTSITQALAYQKLISMSSLAHKQSTTNLLELTRYAIQKVMNTLESDKTIWQARRHKDIPKKIQMFIFKTLHNTFKIGDFWSSIPTYEHRAQCHTCNEDIESMTHILTECNCPARKRIWKLAERIWPTNIIPWPEPTIGTITGCVSLSLAYRFRPKGTARLLRIIISESAYLIWTMRCARVIQGVSLDNDNITKRWTKALNNRLQQDRATARKLR